MDVLHCRGFRVIVAELLGKDVSWDDGRLLEYIESRGTKGRAPLRRKLGVLLSSFFHAVIFVSLIIIQFLAPVRDLPKLPATTIFFVTPVPQAPPPPPPPPLRLPRVQPLQQAAARVDPLPEPYRPAVPASEPEEDSGHLKPPGGGEKGESQVAGGSGSGEVGGVEGSVPGGVIGGLPNSVAPARELAARAKPLRIPPTSREAVPIVRVNPVYPDYAVKARVEGWVTLDVLVNEKGEPESLQVIRSHMLLESAALDAVKQWRWRPYLLDGEAIAFKVVVTIQFQLATRR
jgi:protein TonB